MSKFTKTPELDNFQKESLIHIYRINNNMQIINMALSKSLGLDVHVTDLALILKATEDFIERLDSILNDD